MKRPQTPAYKSRAEAREAGEWAKKVVTGVFKYGSEKLNTEGGFLVPNIMADAIAELRDKIGVFRRYARVIEMSSDEVIVPKRTSGQTAYYNVENTAITESQSAWDQVKLVTKKLSTNTRASSELIEDAAFLGEWLTTEIAYNLETALETAAWAGDGTNTYAGIAGFQTAALRGDNTACKATATANTDTWVEFAAADMALAVSALPSRFHDNAAWYVHPNFWGSAMCRLAAAAGAPQYVNGELFYMGYPVRLTPGMTSGSATFDSTGLVVAAFGDLSKAAMLGERRVVNVRSSDQRYLEYDQVEFVGTTRFDVNWHGLGDTSTAGAMIALIGG